MPSGVWLHSAASSIFAGMLFGQRHHEEPYTPRLLSSSFLSFYIQNPTKVIPKRNYLAAYGQRVLEDYTAVLLKPFSDASSGY